MTNQGASMNISDISTEDLLAEIAKRIDRNLIDVTIANDGTLEDLGAALIEALGLEG